jgi:ElaB/YqjD/DUF883 family membrane-anchored ribosome-binding protein
LAHIGVIVPRSEGWSTSEASFVPLRSGGGGVAWFLHRALTHCNTQRPAKEKHVSAASGTDSDLAEKGNRNSTTQRAAERAHQTIDRAADMAEDAEQSLRAGAARAGQKLKEGEELAAESLDESITRIRAYVEKNPLASAGIAFAAGVLVSTLLRR